MANLQEVINLMRDMNRAELKQVMEEARRLERLKGSMNFGKSPERCFSPRDLATITVKTDINDHSGNLVFIAEKLKSPLLPELRRIARIRDTGGLSGKWVQRQRELREMLMQELKTKCGQVEAQKVYSRL